MELYKERSIGEDKLKYGKKIDVYDMNKVQREARSPTRKMESGPMSPRKTFFFEK